MLHNDIITPSSMYPDGNPMCPNDGNSGYSSLSACSDDAFARAQLAAAIGTNLKTLFANGDTIQDDSWGYGVFYGTDANAADQRCLYSEQYNGYDCPGGWIPWGGSYSPDGDKKGAGNFPSGNPAAGGGGGGAGCHYNQYNPGIDQYDAGDPNLVGTNACECNYDLKGNFWRDWVNQWINHGAAKSGYSWMGWFGSGKAPSFGMDFAACWVNNPRDMINMQNAMWWLKDSWNNLLLPKSFPYDGGNPQSQRRYWGWNEIPLDKSKVENAENWDAVVIKLPPTACGGDGKSDAPHCLSSDAGYHLEGLFDWYIAQNFLKSGAQYAGQRPGSYVVFLKEYFVGNRHWQRQFFCDGWKSPGGKYEVVYTPIDSKNKYGDCHLQPGSGPAPPPPSPGPTPSPGPSPSAPGGPITSGVDNKKCLDLRGGKQDNGNPIQIWDCNGVQSNQNWVRKDGTIRLGANQNKCIDFGNMQVGQNVMIWDCNGQQQQKIQYDSKSHHIDIPATHHGHWTKCMDLAYGKTYNGQQIGQYWCQYPDHSQEWYVSGGSELNATQVDDLPLQI